MAEKLADQMVNYTVGTSNIVKNESIQDGYSEFIDEKYEIKEASPGDFKDPKQVKSIIDMVRCLESNPRIQLDARVLGRDSSGKIGIKKIGREEFLEAFKKGEKNWEGVNLRESFDSFATDAPQSFSGNQGGPIGQDFVPLLGGPFYKNLYFYDFIYQANAAFYAYNHDPIAHQGVNILKEFTLGRGFRVDSDNKAAMALWAAFEKANRLQEQFDKAAVEISVNGEIMWWKLPNHQTTIVQNPYPGQPMPKGIIPRVRLTDATVFWEVVTVPEDVNQVLYYVWVAPTQWQMYTGLEGNSMVPTSKFIFQTIPADQIMHYKVNAFSNEKRGRSDLFPVLGFLKRLRDSVNYSLVALQKQASWCIDTTIEGNQGDIDAYIQAQQQIGTNAPAGSEFVHSAKITREYKGVEGTSKGGGSVTFEWALSNVASGLGIPVSYFGTHLSGDGTRAGAIVATEPVAKRFEARQKTFEQMVHDMWDWLMETNGIKAECEVTFPEITTADRTQKLQDLSFAENMKWISKERAGNASAKEFGFNDYVFDSEQEKIKADGKIPAIASPLQPLVDPGAVSGSSPGSKPTSDVPSNEKVAVKDQHYVK